MRVDELAVALRNRDALSARGLYAELSQVDPRDIQEPRLTGEIERAIAASVVELLASRRGLLAPPWTRRIAKLTTPFVLVTVRLPEKLERLERETPPELRARNLVAPEGLLMSV